MREGQNDLSHVISRGHWMPCGRPTS